MSTTKTSSTPTIPAELLGAALALDDAQRLALGYRLIESVESVDPAVAGFGWPEGWREELERRALAVEKGEPTISHEDLMARLRGTLDRARDARLASATVNP